MILFISPKFIKIEEIIMSESIMLCSENIMWIYGEYIFVHEPNRDDSLSWKQKMKLFLR